ncbi:zinc finger, CCHC-type containing protein [Tanacetum coccineum]
MLSALRLSVMRTASTAAKPCQEDSSEFYLITGSIYTDPRNRGDIANHIDEVTKTLSDELLKLKNFKKDATLKLFKSTNQERYEHVGPEVTSSQDGKVTRWRNEIMLGEEERSEKTDVTTDDDFEKPTKIETEMPVKEVEKEDEAENELNKKAGKEETTRAPSSQPIEYYLKHKISKKLIEGHVGNHRGLVYEAILRKKITRKEDIRGNFEIPYNIGDLKHMNALVDQGSDINVMPLSTYMKLTDERPAEIDIRLSLASHSYIYPLGIAEDVLVEVAEHVYPVDFVILDIKEDENRPFILETPFLTTTKAIKRGVKNDIEPIAPTMAVNTLVLEWEKSIKHHLKREMEFDQWKSKNFKGKHLALVKIKGGMDDEGEVT